MFWGLFKYLRTPWTWLWGLYGVAKHCLDISGKFPNLLSYLFTVYETIDIVFRTGLIEN